MKSYKPAIGALILSTILSAAVVFSLNPVFANPPTMAHQHGPPIVPPGKTHPPTSAPTFVVVDLGSLVGPQGNSYLGKAGIQGEFALGSPVDELHGIVGYSDASNGSFHAFIFPPATQTMTDLGTLGGSTSIAFAINTNGQVTGAASNSSEFLHAFSWANGSMTDLGTLPGGTDSISFSINASGQIVGESTTTFTESAFLYSGGVMTDVGAVVAPSHASGAKKINSTGQVIGGYFSGAIAIQALIDPNNFNQAFLYSNGSGITLGFPGDTMSSADDINSAGDVAGYSDSSSNPGVVHAFLYSNGTMSDLGTLGGPSSKAKAINVVNGITGTADTTASVAHAFYAPAGLAMVDLGDIPGFPNGQGNSINGGGEIAGTYFDPTGQTSHAVVYAGGVLYDLNTLTTNPSDPNFVLNTGDVVTDIGSVVGEATVTQSDGTTSVHAYVAIPQSINKLPLF